MANGVSGAAAIAGLGITEMTRQYTGDSATLALRALKLALDDGGLTKQDVDGLLINNGSVSGPSAPGIGLQAQGGFTNLRLMNHMSAAGSTAGQMIQYASLAIH